MGGVGGLAASPVPGRQLQQQQPEGVDDDGMGNSLVNGDDFEVQWVPDLRASVIRGNGLNPF